MNEKFSLRPNQQSDLHLGIIIYIVPAINKLICVTGPLQEMMCINKER